MRADVSGKIVRGQCIRERELELRRFSIYRLATAPPANERPATPCPLRLKIAGKQKRDEKKNVDLLKLIELVKESHIICDI
jgi:hypothetical protein